MPNLTLEVRRFLSILFFVCLPAWLCAQATSGSTGLLNVPSAEMQKDGTFLFGSNYLPENFTPERFNYDTGNYYLNLTFLPFMEVTYRCTLFKSGHSGGYTEQYRTFGLRLQALKEKKYRPAIVIGANDLYSHERDDINKYFSSYYLVASKNLKLKACTIGVTIGNGINSSKTSEDALVQNLFGGVSVTPSCLQQVSFIAEYDSNTLNVGATALLFKHLYLHAFVHDFENVVGGFAYKIYLKK